MNDCTHDECDDEGTCLGCGEMRAHEAQERRRAAADEMHDMLEELEWCVPTFAVTGNDTIACPSCGANKILGLNGKHLEACRLAALLRRLECDE